MRRESLGLASNSVCGNVLSAASILAPMKSCVLWEETKAGLEPHCGVECTLYSWVGVCCLSSLRSWLWELGCPTPISEPSVFASKCPPRSGDGKRTAKHPDNKNLGSLRTAKSTVLKMFLPIAHPMMAVPVRGRKWTFIHGELISEDGEEGSVISSRLLPLPQAVPASCHEPRFDVISISCCLLFYLETSPEGTLCSTWALLWGAPADYLKGGFYSQSLLDNLRTQFNVIYLSVCLFVYHQSVIYQWFIDLSISFYLFFYFGLLW